MGCTEKHDKMKVWHVKIEIDCGGILEEIITKYSILQREN